MTDAGPHASRCLNHGDAIHRALDLSARRLRPSSPFLARLRKCAWLNGFCTVINFYRDDRATARRENLSSCRASAAPARRRFSMCKIFFTDLRRKRARNSESRAKRANQCRVIRARVRVGEPRAPSRTAHAVLREGRRSVSASSPRGENRGRYPASAGDVGARWCVRRRDRARGGGRVRNRMPRRHTV